MGTKRLPMRQIREILRLKHEQRLSHRAIARACRVGVGTVSEYVGRAARAGLEWPLPGELDEAALEARLFPRAGPASREHALPDVEGIHQELKRVGVTLHLLWEEYREAHPDGSPKLLSATCVERFDCLARDADWVASESRNCCASCRCPPRIS